MQADFLTAELPGKFCGTSNEYYLALIRNEVSDHVKYTAETQMHIIK